MGRRLHRAAAILSIVALAGSAPLARGAESAVEPWRGPIRVPPVSAPHPRLFVSRERLQAVRARIAEEEAPWHPAWLVFRQELEAALASGRRPQPYTGDEDHRFHAAAVAHRQRQGDGALARDLALAHVFSGDAAYADAALAFLLAWADARPHPASGFDPSKTARGEAISGGIGSSAARGIIPFAYAYDLLHGHPALGRDEAGRVETWFRAVAEQIRRGMRLWEENAYFNRQEYQNHVVAHMAGLVVIGYAVGDREMLQFALDHPDNPRDFRDLIAGTIFMAGDPPHHRESGYTQAPTQTGEIYDRYRHFTARGGIPRGLQYAHLSLSLLTIAAEAAWHNGLDLHRYTADSGESLPLPFGFYADFHRTRDASIKGGFYAGESERLGKAGDATGLFELSLARHGNIQAVRDLLAGVNRTAAAHRDLLLGPTVLTHGVPTARAAEAPDHGHTAK